MSTTGIPKSQTRAHAALLAERLAEQVCVLFGWTAGPHDGTERGKALSQLWMEWYHAYQAAGGKVNRKSHPELADERITQLAAERDEIEARTMAAINELIEVR